MVNEKVDAYSNEIYISRLRWFKIFFATPILYPLRFLLVLLVMVLGSIVSRIVLFKLNEQERNEKPFTGWREFLKQVNMYAGRYSASLCGLHPKNVGKMSETSEAPIQVIAPHTSFLDVIALFAFPKQPYFISRSENANIPLVGNCALSSQSIFVSRTDTDSKKKTLEELKRRTTLTKDLWPKLAIFPEGTTTNGKALAPFKVGAFVAGKPVQPTIISYPGNPIDTITWTWNQKHGYLMLVWLTLTRLKTNIVLEHLPVYHPSEAEIKDPQLYANNVRKVMANALGVATTDETVYDLIAEAKRKSEAKKKKKTK